MFQLKKKLQHFHLFCKFYSGLTHSHDTQNNSMYFEVFEGLQITQVFLFIDSTDSENLRSCIETQDVLPFKYKHMCF